VLIPQDVHRVVRLESSARFVLLVEKDATFQKLLDEGILDRLGPCVLITVSKGEANLIRQNHLKPFQSNLSKAA
jgi:DNA topoisomerase VI subunit A